MFSEDLFHARCHAYRYNIKQDFHLLVTNPRKQKLTIQVKDSIGLTDITIGNGEVNLNVYPFFVQKVSLCNAHSIFAMTVQHA